MQVLECKALAAAPGLLEELLSADSALPAGESAAGIDDSADESAQQCHSQAVAILDQPLQDDESQVRQLLSVQNFFDFEFFSTDKTLSCITACTEAFTGARFAGTSTDLACMLLAAEDLGSFGIVFLRCP